MPADTRYMSPLPQAAFELLENTVQGVVRENAIGRMIAPVRGPFGEEKDVFTYRTWTEVAAADMSYDFANAITNSRDLGKYAYSSILVPYIAKSWEMPHTLWMQVQKDPSNFDVATAASAAYKVARAEDQLLFQGYAPDGSTYTTYGFYQGAGLSESSLYDFGTTVGNSVSKAAKVVTAFLGATAPMPGPYNWVLNWTQYGQMQTNFYSTPAVMEADVTRKMLGGEIFASSAITAATGLASCSPSTGYFDIGIAQDLKHLEEEGGLHDAYNLLGVVLEKLAPRIYQSEALLKMTYI